MTDEIMIIDDWVDGLSMEAHMIVFCRALSVLGVPYTLKDDGSNEPDFDEADLPDHALINEAMNEQYKKMHAAELLDTLTEKGVIRPDRVDGEGNVIYVAVEESDGD